MIHWKTGKTDAIDIVRRTLLRIRREELWTPFNCKIILHYFLKGWETSKLGVSSPLTRNQHLGAGLENVADCRFRTDLPSLKLKVLIVFKAAGAMWILSRKSLRLENAVSNISLVFLGSSVRFVFFLWSLCKVLLLEAHEVRFVDLFQSARLVSRFLAVLFWSVPSSWFWSLRCWLLSAFNRSQSFKMANWSTKHFAPPCSRIGSRCSKQPSFVPAGCAWRVELKPQVSSFFPMLMQC